MTKPKRERPEGIKPNGMYERAAFRQDHCIRISDILHENVDYNLFLTGPGNVPRSHGAASKRELATRICHEFMALMIEDLIERNNIYMLPIKQGGSIKIVRKNSDMIKSIARRKKYGRVDLFESDFNVYEMVYDFMERYRLKRRIMHLDKRRYDRICQLVNEGKRYHNSFS